MGKCPDENGFWTGGFRLRGRRTFLRRLLNEGRENLWGFECSWIDDFECRTYAVLLMGTDRMVYYYDADGDVEEDEDGDYCYYAHGPYDLRQFGTAYILDPFPPQVIPIIPIEQGSKDLIIL